MGIDGEAIRRSVVSGRKLKLKVEKTKEMKERDRNRLTFAVPEIDNNNDRVDFRTQLLNFLNDQY